MFERRPHGIRNHPIDLLHLMASMLEDGFSAGGVAVGPPIANQDLHDNVRGRVWRIATQSVELIGRRRKSFQGCAPASLKKRIFQSYRALVTLRQILDWEDQSIKGAKGLALTEDSDWLLHPWLEEEAGSK
jgi:hypothetical protein